jgi:hypothetical protein
MAAERAAAARKEADKLACDAWNKRMLAFKGPAQPSPTLGDALNAGYGYLEVRCLGCDPPLIDPPAPETKEPSMPKSEAWERLPPRLRWSHPLPDGGELRTLRDSGNFIAGLPKREHDAPRWRAAIQALMLVAEYGGPTMLARIGMMRARYPSETVPTPRKKWAEKYRLVR